MACGAGKWGDWLVPDHPLGMRLTDACELHDALYVCPAGRDRRTCDNLWLIAMLNLVAMQYSQWYRRWLMGLICRMYWYAVRIGGEWEWRGWKIGGWRPCRERWGGFSREERREALERAATLCVQFGLIWVEEQYAKPGWSIETSADGT